MKNEKLYNKTINILKDAYFDGVLIHAKCTACAVGNLVAANQNLTFNKQGTWDEKCSNWWHVFFTAGNNQAIRKNNYVGDAKKEIDSTGYKLENLAKIEKAFESVVNDEDGFKGLMAVVEVLSEIHEADQEKTELSKLEFVK